MVARAIAVLAVATVAFAGVASAQSTFCEYYTGALYSNATSADLQYGLVSAVVARAVTGDGATVNGLFNDNLNAQYFNGSSPPNVNYHTNTAAASALLTHLYQFFSLALGCRSAAAVTNYMWSDGANLYNLHKNMKIDYPTMYAFILQVGASLSSFGVSLGSATDASSEFAYVVALFSQFNRYATGSGTNNFQICTDTVTCPLAQQNVQFLVNADNSVSQVWPSTTSTTATINTGDYVNFRFPSSTTAGITQAASATATTAMSGGIATAANTHTYTMQMNTPGTYYYYSNGAASTGRITVNVVGSSSSSAGSTTMSSTGTGSTGGAAASASLGFAAVLAVAVAAAAVVA